MMAHEVDCELAGDDAQEIWVCSDLMCFYEDDLTNNSADPHADSYIKRIFGENNYTVIDHVDRLPEQLPLLFASLTK